MAKKITRYVPRKKPRDYTYYMKRWRLDNGDLSQTDMAKMLGIVQQTYSVIEAGRSKRMSSEFVKNYRTVTGIDISNPDKITLDAYSTGTEAKLQEELDRALEELKTAKAEIVSLKDKNKVLSDHLTDLRMMLKK